MAETRPEFARAVTEALHWMGVSAETAGPLLGINARTLSAMSEGIVPMRSLIIRFASAIGHQCDRLGGAPDWWKDVDAWLRVAGYPPRRDMVAAPGRAEESLPEPPAYGSNRGGAPPSPGRPPRPAPPAGPGPSQGPYRPPAADGPRAREFYHPVYERMSWGDTFVHIFWIRDRDDRNTFQINVPAAGDYRGRAAQVKRDLESLSREQFERKYARNRLAET